jgi:uncharacterized protein DUF433
MTHEEILRAFPYLTEQDIRACLAFTADRERKVEILLRNCFGQPSQQQSDSLKKTTKRA